jgi:inosine-uridine nucleoside N-ribohydrolase
MEPTRDEDRRWIVVDTDTGLDDALALLYLAAQPDVKLVGITAVFGNTWVHQAARNAFTVLAVAGHANVPVYMGAGGPLQGDPVIDTTWHGQTDWATAVYRLFDQHTRPRPRPSSSCESRMNIQVG